MIEITFSFNKGYESDNAINEGIKDMRKMKKIGSFLLIVCLLLTGCGTDNSTTEERLQISRKKITEMPADFTFRFVWGVYGQSSYNSEDGELIKSKDVENLEDFTTSLQLSDEQLKEIWNIVSAIDVSGYPDEYDPNPGQKSAPSLTLVLEVFYGDFQKKISCGDISMTYESGNDKGQKFLSACQKIENIIVSTDEWKAFPEYEKFYE